MNYWNNISPEFVELVKNRVRQVDGEFPGRHKLKIRTRSGEERWIDYSASVIQWSGKPAVLGVALDITDVRNAEEKIKQSLYEKEVLLKEIHHRVKNNLQIITSLLKLQSGYIKDESVRDMFRETQNRLQSMSLVHLKLYQSKDLGRINFGDYLKTLVSHIMQSLGDKSRCVSIKMDIGSIFLPVDLAIPCGLIINELLTNSIKHAFRGRDKGEICLGMSRIDSVCKLTLGDDGIGIPADLDFRKSPSFGLKLVNTLVEQISARVECSSGAGTKYVFEFSVSDDRNEVE